MQEEETCRVVSRIMLVIHHRNLPQMTTVMMMRSFLSRLSNPIDWRQMEIRCAFGEMRLLRLPMQLIVSQIAEEGKEAPGAEVEVESQGRPRVSGRWSEEEWRCWSVANQLMPTLHFDSWICSIVADRALIPAHRILIMQPSDLKTQLMTTSNPPSHPQQSIGPMPFLRIHVTLARFFTTRPFHWYHNFPEASTANTSSVLLSNGRSVPRN